MSISSTGLYGSATIVVEKVCNFPYDCLEIGNQIENCLFRPGVTIRKLLQ